MSTCTRCAGGSRTKPPVAASAHMGSPVCAACSGLGSGLGPGWQPAQHVPQVVHLPVGSGVGLGLGTGLGPRASSRRQGRGRLRTGRRRGRREAAVCGAEALRGQALEVREGQRLRADKRPVVQNGPAYRVPLHPLLHAAERQVACRLAHDAHGPRVARVGQRLRRRRAGQEGLLQHRRRLPKGRRAEALSGSARVGVRQVVEESVEQRAERDAAAARRRSPNFACGVIAEETGAEQRLKTQINPRDFTGLQTDYMSLRRARVPGRGRLASP
eukprot:scaffold11150_cov57-Phaeocystis_antarctica.AAC.4